MSGRVSYYSNTDATFNFSANCIQLSGDVHPLPGPVNNPNPGPSKSIQVRITNRQRKPAPMQPECRGHVKANCSRVNLRPTTHGSQNNKLLKIAHLNAQSVKCRHHFIEIKEMAKAKEFDILSFSETWFNTTVSNVSIEINGYKVHRLDRIGKAGGGV